MHAEHLRATFTAQAAEALAPDDLVRLGVDPEAVLVPRPRPPTVEGTEVAREEGAVLFPRPRSLDIVVQLYRSRICAPSDQKKTKQEPKLLHVFKVFSNVT